MKKLRLCEEVRPRQIMIASKNDYCYLKYFEALAFQGLLGCR